jgi:hypothetical protein
VAQAQGLARALTLVAADANANSSVFPVFHAGKV